MFGSGGRRWATGAVLSVVVPSCLMACSSSADQGPGEPVTSAVANADQSKASQAPSSAPSPATPAADAPKPDPSAAARVTLAFAGDVHFEGSARPLLSDGKGLSTSLRDTVGRADFAVANLETAVGTGGAPMPGKQFTFRAPPRALGVLADAGFDAVSMANNHAADFGPEVFAQTLAARATSPIPVVGIGKNETEAFTPLRVNVRGLKVSVLGSSQIRDLTGLNHAATATQAGIAANLDDTNLRRAVRAAAQTGDVVVVVMHWGTERTTCADERQRETAKRLVADGADIVVGGHAHRPQGSGWEDGAYIAYGLGNFVWYNNSGPNAETGVLTLSIDANYSRSTTHAADPQGLAPRQRSVVTSAKYVPMQIGSDGVPRAVSAQQSTSRSQAWTKSATCGGLSTNPPR